MARDVGIFLCGVIIGFTIASIIGLTILDNRMDNLEPTMEELILTIDEARLGMTTLNQEMNKAISRSNELGFAWIGLRETIRYEWIGITNMEGDVIK